jgi:hypothetical protein
MFLEFKHLREMNMDYFEHMHVSLNYALILFISCFKALVHSFIPDLFITSTSECILEINNKLIRHNKKDYEEKLSSLYY